MRVSIAAGASFRGFLVPDFTTRSTDIWRGIVESLTMTLTSTVVGVLISIPVGIGAARNVAPPIVYYICRSIITISRSFQEIIIAILFVGDVRLRAFCRLPDAGLRDHRLPRPKLLAEDIEDIDEATGRGDPRHRRGLVADYQLRASSRRVMPAPDRAVRVPARHQFPRKSGGIGIGRRRAASGGGGGHAEHGHVALTITTRQAPFSS